MRRKGEWRAQEKQSIIMLGKGKGKGKRKVEEDMKAP